MDENERREIIESTTDRKEAGSEGSQRKNDSK